VLQYKTYKHGVLMNWTHNQIRLSAGEGAAPTTSTGTAAGIDRMSTVVAMSSAIIVDTLSRGIRSGYFRANGEYFKMPARRCTPVLKRDTGAVGTPLPSGEDVQLHNAAGFYLDEYDGTGNPVFSIPSTRAEKILYWRMAKKVLHPPISRQLRERALICARITSLINSGAGLNIRTSAAEDTPLMQVARCGNVAGIKLLSKAVQQKLGPGSLDAYNNASESALILAIRRGYYETMVILLANGASASAIGTPKRDTPLIVAAAKKSVAAIKILLRFEPGLNLNYRNGRCRSALMVAIMKMDVDVSRMLLSLGSTLPSQKFLNKSLRDAAERGQLEMAKFLLDECGASPFSSDTRGNNALMLAINHHRMVPCTEAMVQLLCAHGAPAVHVRNQHAVNAVTLLHQGRIDFSFCWRTLIKAGIDVFAALPYGLTPIANCKRKDGAIPCTKDNIITFLACGIFKVQ
jgi:ankyrin repeat protein